MPQRHDFAQNPLPAASASSSASSSSPAIATSRQRALALVESVPAAGARRAGNAEMPQKLSSAALSSSASASTSAAPSASSSSVAIASDGKPKDSQLSDWRSRELQKVGYTEVRVAKLSLVDRLLQEEVAELRQRFK